MDDHSTAVFKPVYKSFKFQCSQAMKGLKIEKNTGLKDNNLFISNLKSQDSEVVPNPHPDYSWDMHAVRNSSRVSGHLDWKDSMHGKGQHIPHYTCTCHKEESKETKVAVDNELPELVAFLQESSNYQFFKDICIDKEMPSQENYLVEKCELDHSRISCILDSDLDSSSESIGETLDSESSVQTEHDRDKDVSEQCGSKNLNIEDEKYFGDRDDLSVDHSTKKTVSETLLMDRQGPNTAVLANSMALSKSQAIDDNSRTSKASVRSDLDNASSLGKLTIDDGKKEVLQSAEYHPPDIGNTFNMPDSSEDWMSASETSSGPLAFSGGIPSFGNISLRSNSSTTSSQSFAFPIISSEWNGTPARMGTTDPRQLQRHHRCWGKRFLCCKEF